MIRINIIGKGFLEMFEEGGIGFKKENQLFRFSDGSLGRSSEFSIPDTQNNRLLLEMGGDPLQYGQMLRKRHECQVLYDCGSFMATVAVTAWVPGSFSCVIYMEDSAWLRKIQDLKLADVPWTKQLYCTWGTGTPYDANDPNVPTLDIVRYNNGVGTIAGWQLLPSVDLGDFITEIEDAIGVPIYGFVGKFRLVFPTINGRDGEDVRINVTGQNTIAFTQVYPYFSSVQFTLEWARANVLGVFVGGGSQTVTGFTPSEDVNVTFPTTFPVGVYLLKHNTRLARCEIVGGVDSYGNGDSLAGRTVKLKQGTNYVFVDDDGIGFDANGSYIGWKDSHYPIDVTVRVINASEEMQLGDTWHLADNLPDMTVIEFLRSVALALGREIVFYPDSINFQTPDKLSIVPLPRIISIDSVSRKVEAWGGDAGKVTVSFDSDDYVTDPIVAEYPIDNGQLEGVEDHKSSFSEGNYSTKGVLIQDVTVEGGTPKPTGKKVTIARVDDNLQDLQRVDVPTLSDNDDIAENSTCIKVKSLASESFFFGLAYNDILSFRGMLARWMDAEWSGGVLSMVVQKISQQRGRVGNLDQYVQDGLVLHLDGIKKGNVADAWVDLIGGKVFSKAGNPVFADNHVLFDGASRLGCNNFTAPATNSSTIEVVFDSQDTQGIIFVPTSGAKRIAAGFFSSGFIWTIYSSSKRYPAISKGSVSINNDRCLYNGVVQTNNGTSYLGSTESSYNYIGCRYNSSNYHTYFTGKIYSIRIYNRKLTEAEQLQNLNVDRGRFGIGF